jgi:two-component SAPR family response regulator
MSLTTDDFEKLVHQKNHAFIKIDTLGQFLITREGEQVNNKEWGRDRTLQLFQFLLTSRNRRALHKEQIADRIWEDVAGKSLDQTLKVAVHGINKVLEPGRQKRTDPKYLIRQGATYRLDIKDLFLDVDAFETFIAIGNQHLTDNATLAISSYQEALQLYKGVYLPERMYDDWTSSERERLQLMALNTMVELSELLLETNPAESIRLCQKALQIDHCWEEAYRIQMHGYLLKGNRPMALKTYKKCEEVLEEEFGISPLPETKVVLKMIKEK